MKRYLVFISLLALFLSSCSIDWNDENKEKMESLEIQVQNLKKNNEEQNIKADDLFKKKQECGGYYQEAQKYYQKEIDGPFEIFYSPSNKTCFVAFLKQPSLPPDYNPNDPVNPSTPMVIIDWLTKAQYYISYSNAPEYSTKIKELKGE